MRTFIRFSRVLAAVSLMLSLVIGCKESESALHYVQGVSLALNAIALLLAVRAAERMQDGERFTE